jgi:hypothetical protein
MGYRGRDGSRSTGVPDGHSIHRPQQGLEQRYLPLGKRHGT